MGSSSFGSARLAMIARLAVPQNTKRNMQFDRARLCRVRVMVAWSDCPSSPPAARRGRGGERCSQNSRDSGLFKCGARHRIGPNPPIRSFAMTIDGAFAVRPARAGLQQRSPVIGSASTAVWSAAGRRRPMAMRRA